MNKNLSQTKCNVFVALGVSSSPQMKLQVFLSVLEKNYFSSSRFIVNKLHFF